MKKRLFIVLKRQGMRKSDGQPYLAIKALVSVGDHPNAVGMDVIEQYIDPGIGAQLNVLPGTYEYDSEPRAYNGRLEDVITRVELISAGLTQ